MQRTSLRAATDAERYVVYGERAMDVGGIVIIAVNVGLALGCGWPLSSVQNGELLAEREVLECQLRAEPQGGRNQREQPQNHQDHGWKVFGVEARKAVVSTQPGFWRSTR